jgi:drug/metabolite transporter (DMT)-like permease
MTSSRAITIPRDPVLELPATPAPASAEITLSRALAPLLAVYLIWGSTYLAMRVAIEGFPPLIMSGLRFIIAGSALLAFLAVRGAALPDRRQWLGAIPVSLLLFVGGNGFVALAEVHIGSGVAAVVVATMPLWMGLFAVVGGERPRAREWLGIGLGFVAVAVLSSGADLRADLGATLFLLLAPLAWAAGSMLSRRTPSAPAGLLTMAAAQMLMGGIGALVLGLLMGERMIEAPSARSGLALLYLIVFGALIGFTAYSWLLRNVRPVLATSYAFVNPLLAVVLGAALAGEQLGWATLIAAPAIALAVALAVTARAQPRRRRDAVS